MLTLQKLKEMKPHTIFAKGGGLIEEFSREMNTKWVAVRGGIHDWAIYYAEEGKADEQIRDWGDKCYFEEVIKRLVPCDEEAFKMYRY